LQFVLIMGLGICCSRGVSPGLGAGAGVGITTYNSFGWGLSPWGYGGYGGYGYGYPAPVVVSTGPSLVDFFIWGVVALIAVSAISTFLNGGGDSVDFGALLP
jgi:hypothetical protein